MAVAQILLAVPSERRFVRFAMCRLGHLFPYLPKQPGYHKRMRTLAAQIVRLLHVITFPSPSWCDTIRLLDSTPVPCGQSRETLRRSNFAGDAADGYCASHSRYLWGFRLYLLCASDGIPIAFEPAAANASERDVAAEMLRRVDLQGDTVIADKVRRPDRKGEAPRFGSLGGIRQSIESVFDTRKGQRSLERHGAITIGGLISRITQRLLALATSLSHNRTTANPGRHLTAHDH